MTKTTFHSDWRHGRTKHRRLSRSFDTLAEAERFAEGKDVVDIYKNKGRFKVEWRKITDETGADVKEWNPAFRL